MKVVKIVKFVRFFTQKIKRSSNTQLQNSSGRTATAVRTTLLSHKTSLPCLWTISFLRDDLINWDRRTDGCPSVRPPVHLSPLLVQFSPVRSYYQRHDFFHLFSHIPYSISENTENFYTVCIRATRQSPLGVFMSLRLFHMANIICIIMR